MSVKSKIRIVNFQMKNLTLLFFISLVVLGQSAIKFQLKVIGEPTYSGITLCSDPKFDDCGDFFITLFDPKFCALSKDNTWTSYTFSCQACQNEDIIGVVDGECINGRPQFPIRLPFPITSCAAVLCLQGTNCVNGVCIPIEGWCKNDFGCKPYEICLQNKCVDSCARIRCQEGYICKKGECIKQRPECSSNKQCQDDEICFEDQCLPINICPSEKESHQQIIKCNEKSRPTEKECPMINYIRQPDPEICGLTADGTKKNFVRGCEACMDKEIAYYFNDPCHEVPFVCQEEEECNGKYCGGSFCRQTKDCPYDWQICFKNECFDSCEFKKCANCKFGQCGYEEPSGDCKKDSDCDKKTWSCVGFECVDECVGIRCPSDHECQKGQCVPT